jgi:localization factor PodJL
MSAGAPWSVKGIDPKAREVAKDLARRSGMTLGEWLNSMIMEGDPEEDAIVTPLGRRPMPQPGADRRDRYRRLDDAYGTSTRIPDDAGHDRDRDDEYARITETLERLTTRIESAEGRSTLAIGGVDQAVAGLLARLEAQERDQSATSARVEHIAEDLREDQGRMLDRLRQVEREAESPRALEALRTLETALGKIANQLYEGDARTRAAIGEIREDTTAVTRRMDRVEASSSGAEIQAAVEGVVTRVGERLEQAEARTAGAIRALESSFVHLDDRMRSAEGRLDNDRETRFDKLAEDLSARVEDARSEMIRHFDAAAEAATDGRFDQIDRAIADLTGHVQTAEKQSAQAIEKMGHEVLRIAQNLNRRMVGVEQSGTQAAARAQGEMARMAQAVENRLRRSDEGHVQGLERLSGEIAKISERLSERIAHSERRSALAADDMGERIGRVADKLDGRWAQASGELAERIRQSEERTTRLLEEARESIDRGLSRDARPSAPVAPEEPAPRARTLAAAAMPEPSISPKFMDSVAEPGPIAATPWKDEPAFPHAGPQAHGFETPAYEDPAPAFPAFPSAEPAAEAQPFGHASAHAPSPSPQTFDDFFADERGAGRNPEAPAAVPAFDDFSGDTEFLAPGEVRPQRPPVSTKEAIQAARAAARLGVRNTTGDTGSGSMFGGLKPGGGKSKLAARIDKESKRDSGSTLKKALMASGVAVILACTISGYLLLPMQREGAKGQHASDPFGTTDADHTPLAAVAISGVSPMTPDARAQAETLYHDAESRMADGKPGGVELLAKAANLGYTPAQFELADLYAKGGSGVAKDLIEARRWTERAADGGDRRAMFNLGMYYIEGSGGIQDQTQAAKWFRKSAELGLGDSQYNLARLYEDGMGVTADPVEAYKWYLTAARTGDEQSKAAAAAIKARVPTEERAGAERAAAAFRASDLEPTAAPVR